MISTRTDPSKSDLPRKRILIVGASGFIGSALSSFLSSAGHSVTKLVRRPATLENERSWDPDTGHLSPTVFDKIDIVINLAGENIAEGRWNAEKKRRLYDSRINSAALLSHTITSLSHKPPLFIMASSCGYYGDTGACGETSGVDESAPAGSSFLAQLSVDWENATQPIRATGSRLVNLRIGMVLNARGGALEKMLPAFRLGLGAWLGNGAQYISWVALEDLLRIVEHIIYTDSICGAVNVVAPDPITNRDFTQALGRALHRPTILAMPSPVLRVLFGEIADAVLLASVQAYPRKLIESGYQFLLPKIDAALAFEIQ